jgi:hypothetical protein
MLLFVSINLTRGTTITFCSLTTTECRFPKLSPSCRGCKLSTLGLLSYHAHATRVFLMLKLRFGIEEQAITRSTKLATNNDKGLSLKG